MEEKKVNRRDYLKYTGAAIYIPASIKETSGLGLI